MTPVTPPSPGEPDAQRAPPWRWWSAAAVLALAASAVGGGWALLRSEAGTAWLLRQVPGLTVSGTTGALLGDTLAVDQLRWQGKAGRLELDAAQARGLRWQWRPAPGQWLALQWDEAAAQRVQWQPAVSGAPGATARGAPPASLRLPVALQVPLRIHTLQLAGLPVLSGVQAKVHLGRDGGARHRIDDLHLGWAGGQLVATLQIDVDGTLPLALQAEVSSLPGVRQPWQAKLDVNGPLASPALRVRLQGLNDAARADIALGLAPFAPFPLTTARVQTQALDLSRLDPRWPHTALDAEALLLEPAVDRPLQARVTIRNHRPGRWNEGRLPLRALDADVQADLQPPLTAPDTLRLSRLSMDLGDGSRIRGSGQWQGHTLALELQTSQLQPQALDGRAPAWRVEGAVGLALSGLPSPNPQAPPASAPWQAEVALALRGSYAESPQPVQVHTQWRVTPGHWQVQHLQARAGTAQFSGSGTARQTGVRWGVSGTLALSALDPTALWPGLGAGWHRAPHRLNGRLQADLRLPAPGARPLDWQQITGTAALSLDDSQLAGVPLSGHAALAADGVMTADLTAGGNRITAKGQIDRQGTADAWALMLDAANLATLAPLTALHPALSRMPSAGRVQAQGQLLGRWPAWRGEGTADVQGLQMGPLRLAQAQLRASAASDLNAPLQIALQGRDLHWQQHTLAVLKADVHGTLAAHRLTLDAAMPLLPPEALARLLGLKMQQGTRWAARAEAGLTPDGDAWRWQASQGHISAGGWNSQRALSDPPPADWLDVSPLRAALRFDASGQLTGARADAGRLRLANTVALAWDEVTLDERGQLALQARLESVAIAPLLARWQPDMGWEGNLRLGGRLALALGDTTRIDAVLEREGGDLGVRESAALSLPLGLSDLRLALQAQDGTWTFTQALAGRTLGELGGVQRIFSTPQARWPAAGDQLEGAVLGRVANLGVWGAWVPPGWRLQGAITADARLGGQFGTPALRGEVRGESLGVRNLLQGVHVRDGDVLLRLEGERATVERFELHAGEGTLRITGGANLGQNPNANLSLQADKLQLLSRIDRRLTASGRATLVLAPQTLTLRGAFNVDDGLIDATHSDAPTLDSDIVIRRDDAAAPETAQDTAAPRARRSNVSVDVDLGKRLKVRGRGLDTHLAGRLQISAPAGRLAVEGTVSAVDGHYAAYGQKLEIRRGTLVFTGDAANPRLDVLALRTNVDIEVGVAITGPAQSPRVRLHSNPELSETDKLSWLVLGRDPAGLGRADTAVLQRAALALLAGEGEAPTDTLVRNLGLDDFSVRQDEDAAGTRETVVSLGKQLSRRWYVGYERGVNATVGTWQLIYRVAQRFTLRAQSGAENALDAIWVWRVP